jgi:hypothetical protein
MYLYEISVTNYGNRAILDTLPWHIDVSLMVQGMVGSAVQAFFSYRIWIVSGTIWLAIPGWVGELVRAGISITLTVITIQVRDLMTFKAEYKWLVIFTVSILDSIVTVLALQQTRIDSQHIVRACCYNRCLEHCHSLLLPSSASAGYAVPKNSTDHQ